MSIESGLVLVLLIYKVTLGIFTRALNNEPDTAGLTPRLFLKLSEWLDNFILMSGFDCQTHSQNQH